MNFNAILRRVDPFAVAAFALPLFIYLLTLAPTVTFFDSGEFLTAIHSLGNAHSPGYPLFINYAKPFTWLPFGSIGFRVNIATAVSAALACYAVYLLAMKLMGELELPFSGGSARFIRPLIAVSAAVTFACSARLWLQSNHDKPYPLLAFICALVFHLMLLWRDSCRAGSERPSYVYLGAFLCGLGTGAHQSMILMIPAYAFLMLSLDWRIVLRVREMLIALAFALLGFGIHLHLVVRALQMPLLNWGDPRGLSQFLWTMLRKGYPTAKPDRDLALLWAQINAFRIPYEFGIVGLGLLIAGLATLVYLKRSHLAAAYLIALCSFLLVIAGYFNTPADLIFLTEEFFTPLYLLTAVFIGVGCFGMVRELPAAWSSGGRLVPLAGLILLLPLSICLVNYRENDQHLNYIAHDYASNTLRSLPQDAVLYTWGDSGAFPLWYLQGVERMREDLDLPHTPHLVFDWYLDSMPRMFAESPVRRIPAEELSAEHALLVSIREQFPRRPVFIDFSTRYSVPFSEFALRPYGITYRLEPGGGELLPPESRIWELYTLRGVLTDSGMFFTDLDTGKAALIYASSLIESGEILLKLGMREAGLRELEQARSIAPALAPQLDEILKGYGVN